MPFNLNRLSLSNFILRAGFSLSIIIQRVNLEHQALIA